MSMSDLAVHHGNPASLIAEWRKIGGMSYDHRADELETILVGYALVPADDPCLDRTSDASKAHHAEHGRYLTVTESFADVGEPETIRDGDGDTWQRIEPDTYVPLVIDGNQVKAPVTDLMAVTLSDIRSTL